MLKTATLPSTRSRSTGTFLLALVPAVLVGLSPFTHGALSPDAIEARIQGQRDTAPESLTLRVESAVTERIRRFRIFGAVVREIHEIRGTIASVERTKSGLAAGEPFVLRIDLDVAAIERERKKHHRKARRGWVGPQVFFMSAPVFREGPPGDENPYLMRAWLRAENGVLVPGAGPHSFEKPTADGDAVRGHPENPEKTNE